MYKLLDIDLATIVLLLEAIGIGGVVRLLLLPLDALSRLLLGRPTALLLCEDLLQAAERRLAELSLARLFLFCPRNVLLQRRLEQFALNLIVVWQSLVFDSYVSVGD